MDRLTLLGETLLGPVVIVAVLLFGFALFLVTPIIPAYILSLVLRRFLREETWIFIENLTAVVGIGAITLAFLLAPLIRASQVHRLHWIETASMKNRRQK